jgi:hypothetical protein
MASKDAPPMALPKTGAQIKDLNSMCSHHFLFVLEKTRESANADMSFLTAQGVQALLDFFDIPFVSTMFLHDKKLLYLNFLGASGALKHLVLD